MHTRDYDRAYAAVEFIRDHGLADVLTAINLAKSMIRPGPPTKEYRELTEKNQDMVCALIEKNQDELGKIAERLACDE